MAKTIYNVSLADLLPDGMLSDPKTQALCAAIDVENKFVVNAIGAVSVLDNIGNQPADATDLLAIEQGTPYYSQSLPLQTRQSLLSSTGQINAIAGTKAAIEKTLQEAFASGSVQEWFDYGGVPGHFRVLVNDFPNSQAQMSEINRAIAATKRASSALDEVIIIVATTIATEYIASTFELAVYVNTKMQGVQ